LIGGRVVFKKVVSSLLRPVKGSKTKISSEGGDEQWGNAAGYKLLKIEP
jgi:hypothetical protein